MEKRADRGHGERRGEQLEQWQRWLYTYFLASECVRQNPPTCRAAGKSIIGRCARPG